MWKTYNAAHSGFWIFRRNIFQGKCLCEFVNSFLANTILYVQVMLRHVYICMAYNTLDSRKVNTQSLHLANIGMSARVWR